MCQPRKDKNIKNHTYWILHPPMILNIIKKGLKQKINNRNTYVVVQNIKNNNNALIIYTGNLYVKIEPPYARSG